MLPGRGLPLPQNARSVLHHHGVHVLGGCGRDERRAGGEGPAHLLAAKHGPVHPGAPLRAPKQPVALRRVHLHQHPVGDPRRVHCQVVDGHAAPVQPADVVLQRVRARHGQQLGLALPGVVGLHVVHALHPHAKLVREHLEQPAAGPLAGPLEPPRLFRIGNLPHRPLAPDVDDGVAELVARPRAAARAHGEEPVGPRVPVVAPDVGVVEPDRLGHLRIPRLAVHGPEIRGLHEAGVGDGRGVVRDAGQLCRAVACLELLDELGHLSPVRLLVGHEPQDRPVVVQALRGGVAVEHAPGDGQRAPHGVRAAVVPEPHHVPLLRDVVRGHQEHPGSGVALEHRAERRVLVAGGRVLRKGRAHPLVHAGAVLLFMTF